MKIKMYHVDAFAEHYFGGNPTAVCILEEPLDERTMLLIAKENNLSETAFCYPYKEGYFIQWFTPRVEVDLCGHATLATAAVLFQEISKEKLLFYTKQSGEIEVRRKGERLTLVFPIREGVRIEEDKDIKAALGGNPIAFYKSRDIMVVYETEEEIKALRPNKNLIEALDVMGIIVTSASKTVDYVSRYFGPGYGVFEDPATGSAQCTLVPYWKSKLNKTCLRSKQLSEREADFYCELKKDYIEVSGKSIILFETSFNLEI